VSVAPDLLGPVIGFRSWRVANGRLVSPYVPCRWEGREMHAGCWDANRSLQGGRGWLAEPHASPHPACQCGIYAYDEPGLKHYYGESWWCEGVVSAWGRVVVHGSGWRAEHARVEALAAPENADARLLPALQEIAERLGVPAVSRGALPAIAAGVGAPVPAALRPRAQRAHQRL
jgi:hypothetical protein